MWISDFAIRRPIVTIVVMLTLVLFGAVSLLFLKTDEQNRADFEREGLEPFCYESEGRRITLSYYRAPDEALDSAALMQPWAHSAMGAALRAKQAKTPGRKRKKACP